MKSLVHSANTRWNYGKAVEWVKFITVTGSVQVLVQGIAFISGILVIRLLPTNEYAHYILVNTLLGTMVILADGGISIGVMAEGGKVWQDRQKLGAVLATGLDLRKRFTIASLVISVPLLVYLLQVHGASWAMTVMLILSIIPAFVTSLSGSLLETIPKLHQQILPLQRVQLKANLFRLLSLCLTIYVFPWAFIAILAAGLPQIWANGWLKKNLLVPFAEQEQKPDPKLRSAMMKMVRRRLPDAAYFCFSSQITIWIISFFGTTVALAQVGALSRFAMILNIFSVLFASLILPRFSRLPTVRAILLKRFIQIQLCSILLCAALIALIWIFSEQTLWILGPNYANLKNEVVLIMTASCIGFIAGNNNYLSISRGWVINPLILIPVSIASVVLMALLTDLSSLKGILRLNIVVAFVQLLVYSLYLFFKLVKMKALDTGAIH